MTTATQTIEDHVRALAVNLPGGRVWTAKSRRGSNLNGLLTGLAETFRVIDAHLQRYIDQQIPTTTEDFLAEWEEALGIPDDCFPLATDTATRQRNITIKLSVLAGIQTDEDFVALALLLGQGVSVASGIEHLIVGDGGENTGAKLPALDISGPNYDFATVEQARLTMVVTETTPDAASFTYDYPIPFTTGDIFTMRCLFQKMTPASVAVLFAN